MSGPWRLPDHVGLALVGYRGTGKSTVGRELARALGRSFVDADLAVESRAGRSIRTIFEEDGEPAFRDWEERVLAELTARPHRAVVATGGGAVLRPGNREALRRFGCVVWLRAEPSVLAARLGTDSRRPALTPAGTVAEIADVLAAREPLYRGAADAVIDTAGLTPAQVVRGVLSVLADAQATRDLRQEGG